MDLLVGGHIQNEALLAQLNNFLYDGGAGENLLDMLGGLTVQTNWVLWIAFASIFLLLCAITYLRCGELQKTLARGGLYLFVIADYGLPQQRGNDGHVFPAHAADEVGVEQPQGYL